MSKKIYLITVSLLSLLLIMKGGIVLSQEAAPAEPQEAASAQSIHQRTTTCWDDFEATFPDEPLICQDVCDRCHPQEAIAVPDQSGNPEAVTTDEIYPEDPGDEVRLSLLEQSCSDCHSDKIDPDTNHAVFVEHKVNSSENFKETELKLFDGHILCTTCHSPHSGNVALLRIPNQGSGLCIDCHTI
jgi:predicted CXXCH cytochrome family protein